MSFKHEISRRSFMQRLAALSITGSAAPLAMNLSAIANAAAFTSSDYKAIVCVFLYGANDHYNTIVPYDIENHKRYTDFRDTLAIHRHDLHDTVLNSQGIGGYEYALSPHMPELHKLWSNKKAGVLLNIGPLIQPTSKAEYRNNSAPLPAKLFSHNDQQQLWQAVAESTNANTGWLGGVSELLIGGNKHLAFSSISLHGNGLLLNGNSILPYKVSPHGVVNFNAVQKNKVLGSEHIAKAALSLMTAPDSHLIRDAYASVAQRSNESSHILQQALQSSSAINTVFPNTTLGNQLSMVTKLISAREQLGMKRQVFMVGIGGFDHHDDLSSNHPGLLNEVDGAIGTFYRATEEMKLQDKITLFTASEFGRTLTSNGDGSDHGWGGHQFVVGGAVKGRHFWGKAPDLGDNGSSDVGRGRLLPTTSVEQLASHLGSWLGATDTELNLVLPNLREFDTNSLDIFN